VNLGWKLAATINGWAPEGLLDTYHAERHPVGQQLIRNAQAASMLYLGDADMDPIHSVLAEPVAYKDAAGHLAGIVSGLGIRLRSCNLATLDYKWRSHDWSPPRRATHDRRTTRAPADAMRQQARHHMIIEIRSPKRRVDTNVILARPWIPSSENRPLAVRQPCWLVCSMLVGLSVRPTRSALAISCIASRPLRPSPSTLANP